MTRHLANYPNQPASDEEMLDALGRDELGELIALHMLAKEQMCASAAWPIIQQADALHINLAGLRDGFDEADLLGSLRHAPPFIFASAGMNRGEFLCKLSGVVTV